MASVIPITLVGENLGKRHFYINSLVKESFERGDDFDTIKNIAEHSPIDRFYKIDLASKMRNTGYIIQNLKDDDMLFVSRALKSKWLMEAKYKDIIKPQYLEDNLYPVMITTAVTKMKHWIHINLNDEARCQDFYEYYHDKKFNYAIKFLVKCSKAFIQNKFLSVIHKITPHYFKIFCEKSSSIAKVFFDSIANDDKIKNKYLNNEKGYYDTLRYFLKTDGDMVLDIIEKYYNKDIFGRFSPAQTKFILKNHRNRFMKKPELYICWILNTQAVADSLNAEEAKSLVVKLAKAKYLTYLNWFSYKAVEPFIKRLQSDERAEFKKTIFIKKDFGETEEDWPYETPCPPVQEEKYTTIFDDRQPEPYEYCNLERNIVKRKIKKKCWKGYDANYCIISTEQGKTLLDKLFDEYRFVSFGRTFYDLRKRIKAESSPQNREYILLVLVSKSGGRDDATATLLELLAQHSNEPLNVRAAIVRSLVKRTQVWRLPETSWHQLIQFGQGLGLDGNTSEATCNEGLHAVVIRNLLSSGQCPPSVQKLYLKNFSTFSSYSLNSKEKKIIGNALPNMLISIAKQTENVAYAVSCIDKVIDTLNEYKIMVESYPDLIEIIKTLAQKDIDHTTNILNNLFNAKIARKQLFRYNSELIRTDDSYVNALKHDITVIDGKTLAVYFENIVMIKADNFFTKLSIYFSETNGLRDIILNEFKKTVTANEYIKVFGRPLAILLKNDLEAYLDELSTHGDNYSKLLAAAIKANAHRARPTLDTGIISMKKYGVKYIANKVLKCRSNEIDANIKDLSECKKTAKVALTLSKRTSHETDLLIKLAALRPTIAIKAGLKLIKQYDDKIDLLIWDTIRPIIQELDITKPDRQFIIKALSAVDAIPLKIRPEYSVVIHNLMLKKSFYEAMHSLCHIEIQLPNVNESFVENLLLDFINQNFVVEKLSTKDNDVKCTCLYIRILVKYIFLCKTETTQKRRVEIFLQPFLARMSTIKDSEKNELFHKYFLEMLMTFKYSKVGLDFQYISPLPVIENILAWIQKSFSVDEHFDIYVQLHLSMLYFKALRECVEKIPSIHADETKKTKEGVKLFANLFGKYIAREVNRLAGAYFESIVALYKESLVKYLDLHNNNNITSDFLSAMIKGILEESKGIEHLLGIFLLRDKYYDLTKEHSQELKDYAESLKLKESEWFISGY